MNPLKRVVARLAAAGVLVAAVTPLAGTIAQADTDPITVSLTVSPGATTVGGQVTITAKLTNNTGSITSGALGIKNPDYSNQHITAVSAGCRNVVATIYCGNPQLAPGASITLTATLTTTGVGTDDFTAYGRITNVSDVYAYGALTVS